MDLTVARIAEFASALRFDDLDAATIRESVRRVVDSYGCALGAFGAEPPQIARRLAQRARAADGASLWGTDERVLPEYAAFANGTAVRHLDFNDAYPGTGGHPSDMVAAVVAAAEQAASSGAATIAALVVGYEVYHEIRQARLALEAGLDSVIYTAAGSAVAAARLFGLDREGIGAALSLALTPNMALEVTRQGTLSAWKGCAGANAARNGLFAALLAGQGLTGPAEVIDGKNGFRALVGGFEHEPFAQTPAYYHIVDSNLKSFPSCYHAQSPISAALKLTDRVDAREVASIIVFTHALALEKIGYGDAKWHPVNRYTADHSMPYVVAATLVERRFEGDMFNDARLRDERINALMRRIAIREDPALTQDFPGKAPCRIEVTMTDGRHLVAGVDYPLGHARNPLSDEQLAKKFLLFAVPVLGEAGARVAIEKLMGLPNSVSTAALLGACVPSAVPHC